MGRKIFEAVNLHNLRMKNRLIRSATWEGIADFDGSINDEVYGIYSEIAVEKILLKLKGWRGIATRYAKNTSSYTAVVQICCMYLWLRIL